MQILEKLKTLSKSLETCDTVNDVAMIIEDLFSKKTAITISNDIPMNSSKSVFPLYIKNELIGNIDIKGLNDDDKPFLDAILPIIALKVENLILNNKMHKSVEFHDAMKNIAKIIESQYELSYVIPIIGEIIDTLISNHLIYIFLKENGKFKLEWPSACNDKKINELLHSISVKSGAVIDDNKKTGLFPLINENSLLGCIAAKSTDEELTDEDKNYLEQLASQTSITINRAHVYAEILKHATLDALTGFYNRRQLEERIKQEIASAKRQKTSLCAIMTDIDYFKKVNDTYGHAAGDMVLKAVSKIMRSQLREYDIAARYGGEEFAILLPFTNEEEAAMVAERLRKSVENKVIDISKSSSDANIKNIRVTISLGVYKYSGKDDELLKNADKALYEAKETGRNKVVIYKND